MPRHCSPTFVCLLNVLMISTAIIGGVFLIGFVFSNWTSTINWLKVALTLDYKFWPAVIVQTTLVVLSAWLCCVIVSDEKSDLTQGVLAVFAFGFAALALIANAGIHQSYESLELLSAYRITTVVVLTISGLMIFPAFIVFVAATLSPLFEGFGKLLRT